MVNVGLVAAIWQISRQTFFGGYQWLSIHILDLSITNLSLIWAVVTHKIVKPHIVIVTLLFSVKISRMLINAALSEILIAKYSSSLFIDGGFLPKNLMYKFRIILLCPYAPLFFIKV